MKMKVPYCVFSIFVYSTFAYFFWIDRNFFTALLLLLTFLLISTILESLKIGIPVVLVVGMTHLLFWGQQYTPYLQWPFDFYLIAGAGFAFIRFGLKQYRFRLNWSLRFTKAQWVSVGIINIPSIFILLWYYNQHPEVARQFPIPAMSSWLIPIAIIFIAAVNGLREEIFYRGLLQTLSENLFPAWFVISLQAVLFGSLHFIGAFPQGWIGVALTAVWGSAIAIQYHIFRSITLAWLTHSIADAVMFGVILYMH